MTIKNILLATYGEPGVEGSLRTAAWLVRVFGGHVHAVMLPRGSLSIRTQGAMYGDHVAELLELTRRSEAERAINAEERFKQIMEENNVRLGEEPVSNNGATGDWEKYVGDADSYLSGIGSLYDLIVIDRADQGTDVEAKKLVETVLFYTRTPVLVAPPVFIHAADKPTLDNWRVVVGWNRTPQSAHAVSNALPFLVGAKATEIFSIQTGANSGPPPETVASLLRRHGVNVEINEVKLDTRSVAQQLLAEASEYNADMLVMGAYSHSRLRELVLGGVTRHILDNAGIPVLMSH